MQTRKAIVAGQFYPGDRESCLAEVKVCLSRSAGGEALSETIAAGIVPHAGWVFSGELAAMVFSAIKQTNEGVDTFVIFGACHSYFGTKAAIYDRGCWATPLGRMGIDEELAGDILRAGEGVGDCDAHKNEHSIEVQVPFIQHLFGDAKIVPILVPPDEGAAGLGEAVGEIVALQKGKRIVCIGSTDLTHYGPRYGFKAMGTGEDAFRWAKEVNDREFIDLALKLAAEEIVTNAAENLNACGAGAAAATVAAAKQLGKTKGVLLGHTTSNEVMLAKMGTASAESVGYAAIVF